MEGLSYNPSIPFLFITNKWGQARLLNPYHPVLNNSGMTPFSRTNYPDIIGLSNMRAIKGVGDK
jgi:hypothetical protein